MSNSSVYTHDVCIVLDVIDIGFTSVCISTFFAADDRTYVLLVLAAYVRWARLLYYLQAFDETGPLVHMVVTIFEDMRWF